MIYGVTFNQILQMTGLRLTEQHVPCCSPLLSSHQPPPITQHHIPTPHAAIARRKNASFSFNTAIRTLSHASICQVPLVSQRFHFPLRIHTLWPLMIKSLERMGGRRRYIFILFYFFFSTHNGRWRSASSDAHLDFVTTLLLMLWGTVNTAERLRDKCWLRRASASVD